MEKSCNKCGAVKQISEFYTRGKTKGYSAYCKSCVKENNKEIRLRNPQKAAEYQKKYQESNRKEIAGKIKEYYLRNKIKISDWNNQYEKQKYQTDSLFKAKRLLRQHTRRALINAAKTRSSETLLGCSFEEARLYIENKFQEGMSWHNHGEWHIDHIVPLASAQTLQEAESLCHYTNLQPLWAKDNLAKGSRIE